MAERGEPQETGLSPAGLIIRRRRRVRSPPVLGERTLPCLSRPVVPRQLRPLSKGTVTTEGERQGFLSCRAEGPKEGQPRAGQPLLTRPGVGGRPGLVGPNVGQNLPRQGAFRRRLREGVRGPILGPIMARGQGHDALCVFVTGRLLRGAGGRSEGWTTPSIEARGACTRRVRGVAPKGGPVVSRDVRKSSPGEREARSRGLRGDGGRHVVHVGLA